ncbi:unnamed protein product [Paramecium primaurelia]|uniref:Uncharacterized protein n=1 Tax=Paramecium primaurelia TaxID=5886 RepID=A0A8S1QAH3_PARPR|nr:unnamed protein product [Paramecium primaurelia]
MEKSKQLVLYTVFGSIQVASIVGLNNNKQIFKLKTLVFTDSLTMNKDESITIIGSQGQITFWHNVNQWKSFQTLICHNMAPIYSLSLNPSDNLLISCSYDSTINVIRKSDQQWIIIQIIQVEVHGLSLCFINDDYFVFQPIDLKVQVYQYQRSKDNFVKVKEIAIEGIEYHLDTSFFQYNAAKDILIKSNAQFLNFISDFENFEQLTKSSLFFLGNRISSALSNNGDYLIVINNFEKKFIIYMLKES